MSFKEKFINWFSIIQYLFKDSWKIFKLNKCNYCVGCCSVSTVFITCCLLMSILSTTPLIYFQLAQNSYGEIDMLLTSPFGTTLNLTKVNEYTDLSTIRWQSNVILYGNACGKQFPNENNEWIYFGNSSNIHENCELSECFEKYCQSYPYKKTSLTVIDTEKEKHMKFGKKWKFDELHQNEVYIHQNMANQLKIKENDDIYIKIELARLNTMLDKYYDSMELNDYSQFKREIGNYIILKSKVKGIYENDGGKFGDIENIVFELKSFTKTLAQNIPKHMTEMAKYLSEFNMYENSENIYVNLPSPRESYYQNDDYIKTQNKVTTYFSDLLFKMNYLEYYSTPQLLGTINTYSYANVILGMIVEVAIVILVVISIVLVFSLLTININSQLTKIKIQRIIGARQSIISSQIFVSSLFYSFPAIIIGTIVCAVLFILVTTLVTNYYDFPLTFSPTFPAVITALILTFFIPICGSIIPLYEIFKKSIVDKNIQSNVKIERSKSSYFSVTFILIGIFLVVFAVMVYLVLPRSMLALNLSTMFTLLALDIIFLLIGCVIVTINISPIIERIILYLIYFWDEVGLSLVTKNLLSHKRRNRKTVLLFSTCLGFILYFYTAFNSLMGTLQETIAKSVGTDFVIYPTSNNNKERAEHTNIMKEYGLLLDSIEEVDGYTFVYDRLDVILNSKTNAASIGGYQSNRENYVPISVNTFDILMSKYLKPRWIDTNDAIGDKNKTKVSQLLYSSNGLYSCIMGTAVYEHFQMDRSTYLKVDLLNSGNTQMNKVMTLFKPFALLDSTPKFDLNKSPLYLQQDQLFSLPEIVRMTQGSVHSVRDLPISRIYVKMKHESYESVVLEKIYTFRNIEKFTIDTLSTLGEVFGIIETVLNFYFLFVLVISMIICFFSILSSMYANIQEQKHEIAILMSIGTHKGLLFKTYLFESLVVILSSSLIGIFIGSFIGYTVILQITLFTQTPTGFVFPTLLVITIIILAILFALSSIIVPLFNLFKKTPNELLRESSF